MNTLITLTEKRDDKKIKLNPASIVLIHSYDSDKSQTVIHLYNCFFSPIHVTQSLEEIQTLIWAANKITWPK